MADAIKRPSFIALDDDAETLRIITQVVSSMYTVLATSDPRRALGWVQNDPSVAVIAVEQVLKAGMGLDVLEMTQQLRPEIKRILITGFTDLASIVDGLHNGAIHKMVSKPVLRADLTAALATPSAFGGVRAVG